MNRLCWLLLIPVLVTVTGLVTGANWMVWQTPGWAAMPLGNSMIWLAMVCLAALVLLRRPSGLLRFSALLAAALAIAWGAIGFFLAGNWNYAFEGGHGWVIWWRLSIGTGLLLLLNLCWTLVAVWLKRNGSLPPTSPDPS